MSIIIFITLSSVQGILKNFCSEELEAGFQIYKTRRLSVISRQETWSNIRISSIWEPSVIIQEYKPYLDRSIEFYQKSLKVQALTSPILLSSDYFCLPDKTLLNSSSILSDFAITVKFLNDSSKQYAASA